MSKENVLSILKQNPGTYYSGELIRKKLGISRAAVSKSVACLRKEGYIIDSTTNRGYCLLSSPNLLSEGTIRPWLNSSVFADNLKFFEKIDSTNSYLKRSAEADHLGESVVIANEQTAGKGRLGRRFQSPSNSGIYISFLMRPDIEPAKAINFTACVAVAVCNAIERSCGLRPQIKWTNDILLNNRKICGILTEMSVEGETGRLQHMICGIGINCCQKLEDFPLEIRNIAGSIAMANKGTCDRGHLAAEIINCFDEMYQSWKNGKWDISQYRKDCATIEKDVRVISGKGERNAFAVGVADDFSLIVRYEDGTEENVFSGEVSVRGLEGYV